MTTDFVSPLKVVVLWHPKFEDGQRLSRLVYSHLCRAVDTPTSRGPGIPVFFRSSPASGQKVPIPINLDDAAHAAVVVLIDDQMVNDQHWKAYTEAVWADVSKSQGRHRFFPVGMSQNAFNLSKDIATTNYIRIVTDACEARPDDELLNRLTHELCRQLIGAKSVQEASAGDVTETSPAPLTLFVSHAKKDGRVAAEGLVAHINSATPLKTFFDTLDIAPGFSFRKEIERGIASSALVVIQTDAYSSREWCQNEIMWAKRRGRPVLVVHAVESGERRAFPYAGNVPTVRWCADTATNYTRIVGSILLEVLRYEFFQETFKMVSKQLDLKKRIVPLPCPPELLTCLDLCGNDKAPDYLVYPEPPLGVEELEAIAVILPKTAALTPLQMIAEATT